MPALLKGFLEQVARPNFAFAYVDGGFPKKLLKGKSARVVVSMGMPAPFYSLVYRAHSRRASSATSCGSSALGRFAIRSSAPSPGAGNGAQPGLADFGCLAGEQNKGVYIACNHRNGLSPPRHKKEE